MKRLIVWASFVGLFCLPCTAQQHCYSFKNSSTGNAHLQFAYNSSAPAGFGTITSADIQPGQTWPAQPWCWSTPPGFSATVVVSGAGILPGNGPVIMGNGAGTSDSGVYTIVSPPQPPPHQPAQSGCIPNSYPGNDSYCLLSQSNGPKLICQGSSPSNPYGPWQTIHLSIRCKQNSPKPDRPYTLTCRTDGTHCNMGGDGEFCTGLSGFNVGMHCTQ
jgi:hypothetical protein